MPRLCFLFLFALLSLALPAPGATRSPLADHPDVKGAIAVFEAWLTQQMAYRDLPGVAVAVVYDQSPVWMRGFGYANVDLRLPVTPQTLFRMASHTKMFTAIAILQLRDAGKLRLDDPVSRHLPWFRIQPSAPDDPPITIEHLLSHASGLPREAASPYWTTFQFPTRDEIRQTLVSQRAAYPAEVRWKYSNLAFALAGMVVETVSGLPYDIYVERHILQPLGMTNSFIGVPPSRRTDLAQGYGRRMPDGSRRRMAFMDCQGLDPAAGLTSNLEDMTRFLMLQFRHAPAGGNQILAGATLREMQRVRFLETTWTNGTGLGFQITRRKEKLWIGHGGSLAGYKTHSIWNRDAKIGIVVLSNGDDARPSEIAFQAADTIGEAIRQATRAAETPRWDPRWTRFAGLYRSLWGDYQIVALKDTLIGFDPLTDNLSEAPQRLVPAASGDTFSLDAKTGGASIGEPVTFQEEGGRVVSVKIGQVIMERID